MVLVKKCSKCKEEKEGNDSNFYKHSQSKDGLDSWCKKCKKFWLNKYYVKNKEKINKQGREYWKKNHEKVRLQYINRLYKLNKEQFDLLISKQNNSCAICKDIFTEEKYGCVDHIKEDNKIIIRGLLCRSCNVGLGNFKENLKIVKNASLYMEKTPEFIIS
jgi:hypothetical protein